MTPQDAGDARPPWCDTITVMRAPGKRLAKLIRADGTVLDYDSPYRFNATAVPVCGLLDVLAILKRLRVLPDRCVVRGELLAGTAATNIRRLVYQCTKTGDAPTLCSVPRRWLALDADGIERPECVAASDLEACADIVMETLPRPFQRAACIVQASGSHGIKPGCRLRLWFWCDRLMTTYELMRWLAGTPLDPCVFRPCQPIYTAAPCFGPGRAEHLPARLLELPGEDWLRCPSADELAAPAPKPPVAAENVAAGIDAGAYGRAALIRAADAIVTAGVGKRHDTIIHESRSLARLVRAGVVLERDLIAVVTRAAERAGKADADEIASCIAWGIANPSNAVLPEGRNAA